MNPITHNVSNLLDFIDCGILIGEFLILWVGHHLPWHLVPGITDEGGKRELKRVPSYMYGVGCIWLGCAAYAVARNLAGLSPDLPLGMLTAIIFSAAAGTTMPRVLKKFRDLIVSAKVNNAH